MNAAAIGHGFSAGAAIPASASSSFSLQGGSAGGGSGIPRSSSVGAIPSLVATPFTDFLAARSAARVSKGLPPLSPALCDLLSRLLRVTPAFRPLHASSVLQHPWFTGAPLPAATPFAPSPVGPSLSQSQSFHQYPPAPDLPPLQHAQLMAAASSIGSARVGGYSSSPAARDGFGAAVVLQPAPGGRHSALNQAASGPSKGHGDDKMDMG
jgi:hypothetical protein